MAAVPRQSSKPSAMGMLSMTSCNCGSKYRRVRRSACVYLPYGNRLALNQETQVLGSFCLLDMTAENQRFFWSVITAGDHGTRRVRCF